MTSSILPVTGVDSLDLRLEQEKGRGTVGQGGRKCCMGVKNVKMWCRKVGQSDGVRCVKVMVVVRCV